MADNFYQEESMEPQNQEQVQEEQLPEAIKIGNKAYTQEELQHLVGLGESAKELESKWSTKLDRLMPEYTKARQQLSDYERSRQQEEQTQISQKQQQGQQLTQDELRKQAVTQLRELMRDPDLQAELRINFVEQRQAERLVEDAEYILGDYSERGFEAAKNVNVDELLNHMAQTGIRNPEKALKDMLEPEYDEWKQEQLQSLRPSGMMTAQTSTAGSKQPNQVKVTKENLAQLMHEAIAGAGG